MRSLELDTRQWSATQLALMVALGNQRVNRCYYARPPPCDEAIDATSAPAAREVFLRAKYERRAFTARRGQPPPPPPYVLAAAAAADDAAAIIEAMALGAPLDSPAPADASPAPPLPPPPPDAGAASTGDREDGAEGGSGSGADGGVEGGTAADGAAAEGAAAEGAAAAPVWSETLAREHADPRCGRSSPQISPDLPRSRGLDGGRPTRLCVPTSTREDAESACAPPSSS